MVVTGEYKGGGGAGGGYSERINIEWMLQVSTGAGAGGG